MSEKTPGARGVVVERDRIVEVLDLVSEGVTYFDAGVRVGCSKNTVGRIVGRAGGFPSRRLRRKPRRVDQFSLGDRVEVQAAVRAGESFEGIAARLGFHRTSIWREVNRNGGRNGYRALAADQRAYDRAKRPKPSKLSGSSRLRRVVRRWLERDFSPQQISARLRVDYPNDLEMRISPETIYQSLYVQSRGRFRKDLTRHLRTGREKRKPHSSAGSGRGRIPGMVMISERPAEIEDRAVPGHWEGDLIVGKDNRSFIGTLVERQTRFVMLTWLGYDSTTVTVTDQIANKIVELPKQLRKSLTWDQGKEMAGHLDFTIATGLPVYFCDPHSPWQRGTNENTNGLLRQYFPKGTDLAVHGQVRLDQVAALLNQRPRQTLDWKTPAEKMKELLLR